MSRILGHWALVVGFAVALASHAAAQPEYKKYLVRGAIDVKFFLKDGSEERVLIGIIDDRVYSRRPDGAGMEIATADSLRDRGFKKIVAADGKGEWKLSEDGKKIVGTKSLPPELTEPLPTAVAKAVADNNYLYYSAKRLQDSLVTTASDPDRMTRLKNDPTIKELKEVAAQRASLCRDSGLDSSLAAAYAGIPTLADELAKNTGVIHSTLDQAKKDGKKADKKAKVSEAKVKAQWEYGKAAVLLAHDYHYRWTSWDGRYYYRDTSSYWMLLHGLKNMQNARAKMVEVREDYLEKQYDVDDGVRKKLLANAEARQLLIDEANERLLRVGERLGLVDRTPANQDPMPKSTSGTDDVQRLVDTLRERVKKEPQNPFAISDLSAALAMQKPQAAASQREQFKVGMRQSGELLGLAKDVYAALKMVPAGREFARDQAELLNVAAAHALESAEYEAGTTGWNRCFSPKAGFAVRMLDAALAASGTDYDGQIREQLAWALYRDGEHEKALAKAQEVRDLRKDSSSFQFNLARLLCALALGREANAKERESMTALKAALDLGYSHLGALRNHPDLNRLKADPVYAKEFQKLTRPVVSKTSIAGVVKFTNESKFPLTATVIDCIWPVALASGVGAKDVTVPVPVGNLEPGQSFTVPKANVARAAAENPGFRIVVHCDQTREK